MILIFCIKVRKSFTKNKINLLNYMIQKKNRHSYKSLSTNFLDQHDIKMALHKYD